MAAQAEQADCQCRQDYRNEDARNALAGLEQQDQQQAAGAHGEAGPVGLPLQQRLAEVPEIAQWPLAVERKAEQPGQLTDQYGERDAVHVAVADRFRQQFGDETQAQQPGDHAHGT